MFSNLNAGKWTRRLSFFYFILEEHCFFTSFSKFIVEFPVGWRWNGIPFEIYWLRLYASVAVAMAVNLVYQQHSCCNNYIDIINFCACHKHIIIDKQFLLILLIHSVTQRTVCVQYAASRLTTHIIPSPSAAIAPRLVVLYCRVLIKYENEY